MTPEALAKLHAQAMKVPAPWTAQAFSELLVQKGTFLAFSSVSKYLGGARGGKAPSHGATPEAAQTHSDFALGRVILDEAELLTLAVDPSKQRQGLGRACLASFEAEAVARGAVTAFLEVAETNEAARGLYIAAGWQETGRRKAYYSAAETRIDAILMSKRLAED